MRRNWFCRELSSNCERMAKIPQHRNQLDLHFALIYLVSRCVFEGVLHQQKENLIKSLTSFQIKDLIRFMFCITMFKFFKRSV